MLSSMAGLLHFVKELKMKGKGCTTFGCYGWTGEAPQKMASLMGESGFTIIADPLRNQWNPTEQAIEEARVWGR